MSFYHDEISLTFPRDHAQKDATHVKLLNFTTQNTSQLYIFMFLKYKI